MPGNHEESRGIAGNHGECRGISGNSGEYAKNGGE